MCGMRLLNHHFSSLLGEIALVVDDGEALRDVAYVPEPVANHSDVS